MAPPVSAVELKIRCGLFNGTSARLGTEIRPAKFEPDKLLNGKYIFDLSSKTGRFSVVFDAAEGPLARPVDGVEITNDGQVIKIVSRQVWGEQRFFVHNGLQQKRVIYLSETKLLDGQLQLSAYDAACEAIN